MVHSLSNAVMNACFSSADSISSKMSCMNFTVQAKTVPNSLAPSFLYTSLSDAIVLQQGKSQQKKLSCGHEGEQGESPRVMLQKRDTCFSATLCYEIRNELKFILYIVE